MTIVVLSDPQRALLEQAEEENRQQRMEAELAYRVDLVIAAGLDPVRARRVVYERTHAV